MQTTHLTTLTTHFNPLSPTSAHRIPRLLLARLPSNPVGAGGAQIKIATRILPRGSLEPARLVVGFKGGDTLTLLESTRKLSTPEKRRLKSTLKKEGKAAPGDEVTTTQILQLKDGEMDLGKMGMKDVLEEVGRRCRFLGRREQIAGG